MISNISQSENVQSSIIIQSEPSSFYFTHAKVKRCALIALALIATLATAALVGVVIAGVVSWPFVFITIPLVVIAFFSFRGGFAIKDYDDPKECKTMRKKAEGWSFSEIKQEHSEMRNMLKVFSLETLQDKFAIQYKHALLSEVIRDYSLEYVLDYQLISLEDVKGKFLSEVRVSENIDEVYQKFGHCLSRLSAAKIISPEMRDALQKNYEAKGNWSREKVLELDALHHKYSGRQECLFRELDKEADQERAKFADQQSEARRIGQAGTEIAVAVKRDPKDPLYEQWKKDEQTRILGQAGTEIAIGLGTLLTKGSLEDKLKRIEEKKSAIRKDGTGLEFQKKYNSEVAVVQEKYKKKLNEINAEFIRFRNLIRL